VHDVTPVGHFVTDTNATASTRWSDFFHATPRPDGNYQWRDYRNQTNPFSLGSSMLAYDSTPPDQLRFADFNGDGVTDIFKLVRQCTDYLPLIRR
jgi:hypothetical protein